MRNVVTEDDYALARRMIEDRISGPDNARRPWIVGGDSDVRPMSYTAVEMDYINTRKFNREVISAALGVPAPLIGDADNSTYNNLDTLKRDFWQDTISNWLEELRQDLTRQVLLPYYGDKRRSKQPALRYMYDLSNVEALQANMQEKADVAKTFVDAGYTPQSVANMLELTGLKVAPKPEPVETPPGGDDGPGEDPEPRQDVVENMVRMALRHKDSPALFENAMAKVHEHLADFYNMAPDTEAARQRASTYLEDELDLYSIAIAEVLVCKP